MAEPESILQLGIEAARENKKEEARQLFRLLTRQEPENIQGWLWLAGVAENREERQGALERVLELDPNNEMALKGLQALGVRTAAPAAVVDPLPAVPAPPARDPMLDDDPYAELDNLSDVMADDTAGPVRRTDSYAAADSAADAAAASARSAEASARSAEVSRNSARYVEDDEVEPRRGLSPLLALLLFLVGIGLIGLLIWQWWGGREVAGVDAEATAAALTAGPAGALPGATDGALGGAQPGATVDPNATPDPNVTVDPNATPDPNTGAAGGTGGAGGTVDPNATAPAGTTDPNAGGGTGGAPPADVSGANPAIIQANTPIESESWVYDFPQPTYAGSIIGNLGQFTPNNGRFVVVLIHAINNTGTPQAIPGNFFVLKDAQGRVWEARPEVSDAYVVPGVNADQTHNTPLAPDGNYRSVAVVFDVAPDATDLVFFARSNPSQGWIVLRSV
jgi:hypothetical protein